MESLTATQRCSVVNTFLSKHGSINQQTGYKIRFDECDFRVWAIQAIPGQIRGCVHCGRIPFVVPPQSPFMSVVQDVVFTMLAKAKTHQVLMKLFNEKKGQMHESITRKFYGDELGVQADLEFVTGCLKEFFVKIRERAFLVWSGVEYDSIDKSLKKMAEYLSKHKEDNSTFVEECLVEFAVLAVHQQSMKVRFVELSNKVDSEIAKAGP